MPKTDISAADAEHEKIVQMTGIMDNAAADEDESEDATDDTSAEDTTSEDESEDSTEDSTEEAADEDEDDDEDEDEDEKPSKADRPAVSTDKALKALFSTIKDVQADIRALKKGGTSVEQDAATAIDAELRKLAEEIELDPDKTVKLFKAFEEKLGKRSTELPPEVQEAVETIKEQKRVAEEAALFEQQWSDLIPDLQKQYPNASAAQLREAKDEMDKLSHSKALHRYPLDYIVFKKSKTFDTLLKVGKGRSGEAASRDAVVVERDEVDLDPENMTPDKLKAYNDLRTKRGY